MSWSPAALETCQKALAGVLHTVSQQLRAAGGEDVIGPLARCANRLHDTPPPSAEEVTLLIRTALLAALPRLAQGQLNRAQFSGIEQAYNAALERAPEDNRLLGFIPQADPGSPRTAMLSPPSRFWAREGTVGYPPDLKAEFVASIEATRAEHQALLEGDLGEGDSLPGAFPVAASDEAPIAPQPFDPDVQPPPAVRMNLELLAPTTLGKHYQLVAAEATDTIALLAGHRRERRIDEAQEEELRILELLDALLTTGKDLVENVEHWWAENLDSPDEWKIWAPCYVLGCLEHERAPLAIDRALDELDPEMEGQIEVAAEALHLAQGSGLPLLRRELRRSANPLKRAIGLEAASFEGELSAQDVEQALADPAACVQLAALRAAARMREFPTEQQDHVVSFLYSDEPDVVREASRALLLHGRREPYLALQHNQLEQRLGRHLLEFLVWTGSEQDVPRIERYLQGREVGGDALIWLGLFGHAAMWRFLAHHLEDEELQDHAVVALKALLGPGVDEDSDLQIGAWEQRLTAVAPDAKVRYRRGKPFSADSVIDEYQERLVSYRELERRLDELAIRSGVRVDTPLHGWVRDCEGQLQGKLMQIQRGDAIRVGSWDSRGGT